MRSLALLAGAMLALGCGRQVQVGSPGRNAPAGTSAIVSADQLIDAMRNRYRGKWFRTISFVQRSTYLKPDGEPSRVETWYEAAMLPGRLRIDLGDPARGNGVLYRGDSVYQVQNGRVTQRVAGRNVLQVLAFDAYAQPTDRTLEQLRAERFDVGVLRTDTLNGRRVYVVGGGPGDLKSSQFWVDAERLVVVRVVQSTPNRARTQDIRFENWVQRENGWVAERVRVLVDGRVVFREEYENVRLNVPLDEALFVPEKWTSAPHWHNR